MFDTQVCGVAVDVAKLAVADVAFETADSLCSAAVALSRVARQLDAARAHVLGELAARGTTDLEFGMRTANWLAHQLHDPTGLCAHAVRRARVCRVTLTRVDEAFCAGRVGAEHVRVLVEAAENPRITDDIAALQEPLIDRACEVSFARWRNEMTALVNLLDQDGAFDPDTDRQRQRGTVSAGLDGLTRFDISLTGADAVTARSALESQADRIFNRYQTDREHAPDIVMPTRAQLLAQAFVELCRLGSARDVGTTTPARPEVVIIIHTDQPDTATLGDGTIVATTAITQLLTDPFWRPALVNEHGVVLNLGRTRRLASTGQRRALTIRDGGCVFPGCDMPMNWTDIHHTQPWDNHGHTNMANLAPLCRHHHTITHRPDWHMNTTNDHWFTWTTPTGQHIWSQRHGQQRTGPPPPDPTTEPTPQLRE